MYDRYSDISKFITDPDKLEIVDNEYVYISNENDYAIAADMDGCYGTFSEVKQFIVLIAKHINELDNTVQRFNNSRRTKRNTDLLPSPPGTVRFDYSKSLEDDPESEQKPFPFDLTVIYIEKPDFVTLDYWCTDCNSQFDVTFEYKDEKFYLRKFGVLDFIPDDWDKM